MTILRRSFLLSALAFVVGTQLFGQAAATAPAIPGSMVVGAIKAANVRGNVKKVNLTDKSELPLRGGDSLIQDNAIVTVGNDASAILVFANGSTVRVGGDTRLEIRTFMMDPLQTEIADVAALTKEPTTSRTDLRLEFGEVVGNVKTLDRAAGSSFTVSTPAGAAGIRGTTFRIVYRPTGNGQAFNYQLSTSEGVVLFEGTTPAGAAAASVPVGQEISVVAQIDPATNTLVISAPTIAGGTVGTTPLSPAAASALQEATVQIIQTQQQTTFRQVDMQNAQQQQSQQQGPPGGTNTPPRAPSSLPRTTPGDGGL
jgi:hypothetical protein